MYCFLWGGGGGISLSSLQQQQLFTSTYLAFIAVVCGLILRSPVPLHLLAQAMDEVQYLLADLECPAQDVLQLLIQLGVRHFDVPGQVPWHVHDGYDGLVGLHLVVLIALYSNLVRLPCQRANVPGDVVAPSLRKKAKQTKPIETQMCYKFRLIMAPALQGNWFQSLLSNSASLLLYSCAQNCKKCHLLQQIKKWHLLIKLHRAKIMMSYKHKTGWRWFLK